MLNLKLGKKEYKIKYAYEPTVRSGLIKKLAGMHSDDNLEYIDATMKILPELILIGLQKFHKAEFGYMYDTNAGKEEKLSKVYALLEDYFDEEDSDFMNLYDSLQNELLENSFLSKMFQDAKQKDDPGTKTEP